MLNSTSSLTGSLQGLLDKALAERDRRHKAQTRRFAKWRNNPVGFVRYVLLGFLWSKQRQILTSVRDNRRTAVPSCHSVGKTHVAACCAAWWLSCHEPGEAFVVSLAPTAPQVKALLWREINRLHASGGLPGRMNQTEWYIGSELVGFGRSPAEDKPTSVQGTHARYVLVILDEACGIGKALWDAVDTLLANDDCRILVIGNPDDPATEFAAVCRPGSGWNVIRLDAFKSPNFTREKVPDWLRPLLVGKTWVEEKRSKWGITSPLYLSKVRGQFPEQSEDGLIPLAALRRATERQPPEQQPEGARNELGVDVARFGNDRTVIYHRLGIVGRRHSWSPYSDLMHVVGMVVQAIWETGATVVKVDDIGLGGGVVDRLRELQSESPPKIPRNVAIVGVNVGESPSTERADEKCFNLRAELNWQMRERFVGDRIILVGDNDELLAQAGQIKYKFTSSGEIQIEPKAEMKKRTKGVSPDDWDAAVLCYAEIGEDVVSLWSALAGAEPVTRYG